MRLLVLVAAATIWVSACGTAAVPSQSATATTAASSSNALPAAPADRFPATAEHAGPDDGVEEEPTESGGGLRLYRIDPVSLRPDAPSPLPFGDWANVVEAGGRLFYVPYDGADHAAELRILDLATWEASPTDVTIPASSHQLDVLGDGSLIWLDGRRLMRWSPGAAAPVLLARLPTGSLRTLTVDSSRVVAFGFTEVTEPTGLALVVDVATGDVTEIPVPGLFGGAHSQIEGIDFPVYTFHEPGVAYDPVRDLLYVVHADRDHLTTIDVARGRIVHDGAFTAPLSWYRRLLAGWFPAAQAKLANGDRRTAVLSPGGDRLYVASGRDEVDHTDGEVWQRHTPRGLVVIDTRTSREIGRLDLPIDFVAGSPDGATLVLTGSTMGHGDDAAWTQTPSPVYVVDAGTLEVRHTVDVPGFPHPEFGARSDVVYLHWYDQMSHVSVLDVSTGVTGAEHTAYSLRILGGGTLLATTGRP